MVLPSSSAHAFIAYGHLGRPHGLRGELSLHLHNEASEPQELALPLVGRLGPAGVDARAGAASRAGRSVELVALRPTARAWLATFEGVRDRSAAEALVGFDLWLPRAAFGSLRDGEVFVQDLIGFRAMDLAGRPRGIVRAILWNGAHDILSILPAEDSASSGEWLVPAVPDFLASIDPVARVLVIDPHE